MNAERNIKAGPQKCVMAPATFPKMACIECSGEGTAEYMALDETDYHVRACHVCEGTGLVEPYCGICGGKLTIDGFCYDCDAYPEGFEPEGWLKAETSALGMGR